MGLFSLLKSEKSTYTDKVWRTRPMALRGMITEALKAMTHNEISIVFTFFDKTQQGIVDFLKKSNAPYFQITSELTGEAARQEKVVFLCDAGLVQSPSLLSLLTIWSTKTKVTFLFAGHYPLPTKEKPVVQKLALTFPKSEMIFCSSLDDPSFSVFGSDRMVDLLDKLGMKEDEAIEHALVTKAMENAREKVENTVRNEITANSEEDWFAKNLKKK
jgi:hypothetical protein